MAKRTVIDLPGLPRHKNPIPTAVRVGPFVFSSALTAQDPETETTPDDPARQAALVFANMRRVIEAAGGTTDDLAKVTVFLKDLQYRDYVNQEWLKMFPNEADRPVRHTIKLDLPGKLLIQVEFIAVL